MSRRAIVDHRARVQQSAARLLECLSDSPLVSVGCPACESIKQTPVTTRQGVSYVRCGTCSCFYVPRRPTEEALVEMYRRFPESARGHEIQTCDSRAEEREAQYRLKRILQVVPAGRLLDLGCGTGHLLRIARPFFDGIGVDVAPRPKPMEDGIQYFQGRLEDTSFQEESFHVVGAFEVLEHLFDPASTLRAVHRVLMPSGMFVFQTGDADSLRARLGPESWPYLQPPVHLNVFGRRSLAILLRRTGFRIVKAWSFGRGPSRIMETTGLRYPEFLRPLLEVAARFGIVGRMYAALRIDG